MIMIAGLEKSGGGPKIENSRFLYLSEEYSKLC